MNREEFFREAQRRQLQYQSAKHLHLKPCPFCGTAAELRIAFDRWLVECPNWEECGASGPHRSTPDTAAVAWNRRAQTALAAAVAAYKAATERLDGIIDAERAMFAALEELKK